MKRIANSYPEIIGACVQSSKTTSNFQPKPNRIKAFLKIPAVQFILLGLAFIIILFLGNNKIIPTKYITVATTIMIYTIVTEGFCLLLGYAGLASLGSACFVGIGAYSAFYAVMMWGLPYIVGILIALAISLILGLAIGFISLRIQGLFLGIVTLGLSEIIRNVLREIYSQTVFFRYRKITQKLFGVVNIDKTTMFIVIAVMMVICLILLHNIMTSPTGRNMVAMKSSTAAAQAFGISLLYHRVLAFIIACMLAALTGVCYISSGFSITPTTAGGDPALAITLSLNVLAAVIIGGYKSLWGTFVGVFIVFGSNAILSAFFPTIASKFASYVTLIIGVLMIVITMFYPGGLAQLVLQSRYKRKVKKLEKERRKYGEA